jgi:hypothetical protein
MPKTAPVASVTRAEGQHPQVNADPSSRGGHEATRPRIPATDRPTPTAPPAIDTIMDSVSSCRAMRAGCAQRPAR